MKFEVSNLYIRPTEVSNYHCLHVEPKQTDRQTGRQAGRQTDGKTNPQQSPETSDITHVPIIENLTAQYMSPNPPTILIALLNQPIVPEDLRVEIKDLERRVVHVHLGSLEEEEAVMVDEFQAAV